MAQDKASSMLEVRSRIPLSHPKKAARTTLRTSPKPSLAQLIPPEPHRHSLQGRPSRWRRLGLRRRAIQNLVAGSAHNLGLTSAASTSPTAPASTGAGTHNHAVSKDEAQLPPGATAGPIITIDEVGLAVFEDKKVRHEVLVKIKQLTIADVKHGLHQVEDLDLAIEGGAHHALDFYRPKRYMVVNGPVGLNYIGEVEIEQGKSIHVRCHKASHDAAPTFHSIHTRLNEDKGAVFATGEPLTWFEY